MTLTPSPLSAPEAGELARRLKVLRDSGPYDYYRRERDFMREHLPAIIAALLKLAETEKQLAEADAVIAFELSPLDDYRPLDRDAHTRHLREAIDRHARRSAATSGKGE